MAGIKDTFSKGITTLNVKTTGFMEQNKINTYISTLESEIKDLELQIGQTVYEKWTANEFEIGQIEELLTAIKIKLDEIENQKQRIDDIRRQERQILGSNQAQAAPAGELIYCSQCGAASAAGFKFCAKCGSPIG